MSSSSVRIDPEADDRWRPDLLTRRHATLGTNSPLFYDEPLELVAGQGVWLTDSAGNRYLDGYNNVPHVGHANPVVADAVAAQLRLVNLHTRYLNDRVVEYAEALLDTFDGDLARIALTNSGSEANDLALRIARQHTGHTGVLVSDFSYHGNTTSLAELTTGITVQETLGAHVRTLRIPDVAALDSSEHAGVLTVALQEAEDAIRSLQQAGHGVSALLVDPLFSTEGLTEPPAGYVEALIGLVKDAGGLVIADEVQSGFGRVGTSMWGHQMWDATPDLVVLGKPMGNGHPLGGVVTTEALLEEFGSHNMYFNTFAGAPASSVAGMAVLQVMDDEKLLARAAELGAYVDDRLRAMVEDNPRVRAVRGRGLYFGLELVDPEDPSRPDPATTKNLIEDMRRRGVLISRIGRHDNVLKMRPPLVVTREDIDVLLTALTAALAALDA